MFIDLETELVLFSYTSNDVDLDGFQSVFQTAYRVVDSKFNDVDSALDAILNKKK